MPLNIRAAKAIPGTAGVIGLRQGLEHVKAVSVNAAPIDRGDLRNSADVSIDPSTLTGAISYDTPYAVRQHEEMNYRHEVGQAKYLEQPMAANSAAVLDAIAAQIRRALT